MALHLSSSAKVLPGIGEQTAKDLRNLGIISIRDLLMYFPFRYDDFSISKPIDQLKAGDTVTIEARIASISSRRAKNNKLTLTEAIVEDDSGSIKVTWFNQSYLKDVLKPGKKISLAGVVQDKYGLSFTNPVHEPAGKRVHTGRIVPVYGLSGTVTMRRLRTAIKAALRAADELIDWLPESIKTSESFPCLSEAIKMVHFPDSREELEFAIDRLKFDELFLHQMLFAEVRRDRVEKVAQSIETDQEFLKKFVESLPFTLTRAQRRSAWEIIQDYEKEIPMNRLLEGDVGSGKTAVAAIAIAHALKRGISCAYLAPTEILAAQQQVSLTKFISDQNIGLLTASRTMVNNEEIDKKDLVSGIDTGDIQCVVGTHALLQQSFDLKGLGLVVIDEQHRFGVQQRHALLERDPAPHLLSMTATPIPRSLALTLYGDLELSILDERPKGRKAIGTKLVPEPQQQGMWNHVREQIDVGYQVYVVCPLIDPSDKLGAKSVTEVSSALKKNELKGFKIGTLHGKMKSDEKEKMIKKFQTKKIDVLVSTTVVEVGVDVPNATVMVIYGAERFGLAQLHQLRGRVGRSEAQSYCYLLADNLTSKSEARLLALETMHDGFALAEKDLELRGAGNIFGNAQSGFPDFKLATSADVPLMKKARDVSQALLSEDQTLEKYPLLRDEIDRSLDQVHME